MRIKDIHHITAITGDIQGNLDFYIGVLGLRLAKRTVIQEEPSTYHLFYGDAVGSVGTDLTFFDWPHVGHDRPGARNILRTFFSVADEAALIWWSERLAKAGLAHTMQQDFAGRASLHFADPEGQRLGIVAAGPFTSYQHWRENVVPQHHALQALHSVTLGVDQLEATVRFLSDLFGYEAIQRFDSEQEHEGQAMALKVDGGGVGKELVAVERSDAQPGLRGIGSVHHVALTIAAEDSIEQWHERIKATGLKVSAIMRRYYFDSIYVRIPGGILFELATESGPGLTIDDEVDEEMDSLGQRLTLPPFLEPERAQIEARLKPITVPKPRII
jgi:glyoxalase family protein